MNARNCQLCGKPLSRLRVGGDGDFCSKEHRNQFRLRAGMDRLVEVNKVASLMRRRESARHIPRATMMCRGITARRDFGNLIPTALETAPRLISMRPSADAVPRIAQSTNTCMSAKPAAVRAAEAKPRTHAGAVSLGTRERSPQLPARERDHQNKVGLTRGNAAALPLKAAGEGVAPRDFTSLPPAELRTYLGQAPCGVRRAGRASVAASQQPRRLPATAVVGNALRVSSAQGFRVPRVRQPESLRPPQQEVRLSAAGSARPVAASGADYAADQKILSMDLPPIAARIPTGPAASPAGGFAMRDIVQMGSRMLRDMPAIAPRPSEIVWSKADPSFRPTPLSQCASGFARRNGAHFSSLTLQPMYTGSEVRVENAPFIPRDELFVPKVPYCNVLAAAATVDEPQAEPVVAPAPRLVAVPPVQAVKFEEHFGGGWDDWVGGVADWKVDIAGVRTGSLALYKPTLELSDYDLEFLARIDTHSVTWVVRAAENNSHIRCSLNAVEGGQLEFSRTVVRDGVADATAIASSRVPGKPRTAITVRMSVAGPVFSASVDGKTIDSWVDDRLATGGIGFVGTPDDRARLYWVRVSSPAAPSKEHYIQ